MDLIARCIGCDAIVVSQPKTKRRRWCSERCRVATFMRQKARQRPPMSRVYFGTCKECGKPWSSRSGSTRYCSVECRTEWHARARLANGGARAYVERRRVRRNQAPSETIKRLVVAERDGWTCWICELSIDQHVAYPDPLSLSIDHVQPLARGGHHTYANVRAAHLCCNIRRGAADPVLAVAG